MADLETKEEKEGKWTTVIKSRNGLFDINLREIWQYRDLFSMFVKRDIITSYKQTILGPLWFFIQPALTTVMYMVVFGGIAGISTDGLPQALFYLAGILCWQYFADCLNKTSNTFVANQSMFGKVYFPRLVVPLSTVVSNLIKMFIQFILFAAVYVYYLAQGVVVAPNWYFCLFPVLIFMLAGIALGFGIIISSLTTKYRDLTVLFTFIVQLWMYATPVIYPLSTITSEKMRTLMLLNPITSIIEAFKYGALGIGSFEWSYLAYSFCFMIVLLALGIAVFNKVQRSFMDTV